MPLDGAWAEWKDSGRSSGTDLCDAWVGTLDILAGQVEPAGGVRIDGRAVVPQGAPSFSAAPAALELPLRFQAHAAAVPRAAHLYRCTARCKKSPSKDLWPCLFYYTNVLSLN